MKRKERILPVVNFEIFLTETSIEISLSGWRRNQYKELLQIYKDKPVELLEAVLSAYKEDLELVELLTKTDPN